MQEGVEIGMTELIIIHDDMLEHFELHMATVLGSVCLAFQQLPGHLVFLMPGNQLSKVFPKWQD